MKKQFDEQLEESQAENRGLKALIDKPKEGNEVDKGENRLEDEERDQTKKGQKKEDE